MYLFNKLKASPFISSLFCLLLLTGSQLTLAASDSSPKSEYLPLDPPFVVNVRDGERSRFLQVKIQLRLEKAEQAAAVLTHHSALRHSLIMLLSEQNADDLYSITGKERLRASALAEARKVLKTMTKNAKIEDLFFTTFIIQ